MTIPDVQKVILACRRHPAEREEAFHSRLEELIGLCDAAGGEVVQTFVQTRPDVDAGLYLGSGKVTEVAVAVDELGADVVVFDGELSPGQVRNLEGRIGCRVIDRTQLILDIFALRARSREGRLQVEIAQLQYLLPRLTGRGAELSRLGGGIGTRGPGETKLETDRRRIRQRIDHLRQALKQLRKTRATQRAKRSRTVPVVALVGYTNAGKSTLMSRWTQDRGRKVEELGHDRLFDTLDPLARKVRCGPADEIVLLDTVGFVQDLPHLLVEAFRTTLEEAREADLIVHVVDASTPAESRLTTTYQVLSEIGALDKPVITFFNKMDLATAEPPPDLRAVLSIYGSAATGANVDALYDAVERQLGLDGVRVILRGPTEMVLSGQAAGRARVLEVHSLSDATVEATYVVSRKHASLFVQRMNEDPRVVVEWQTGV